MHLSQVPPCTARLRLHTINKSDNGLKGSQYNSGDDQHITSGYSRDNGEELRLGSMRLEDIFSDLSDDGSVELDYAPSRTAGSSSLIQLGAMHPANPDLKGKARADTSVYSTSRSAKTTWLQDTRIRRITDPAGQPKRDPRLQRCLSAEVNVNGLKAYTLFDSGCTTNSILPELAYVVLADRVDLTE
ncbi:hypothetical protein B0H21DRAFT_713727 [Amylocystis lapponica]|nr:hypothetical protein B0H21DRAFT_713727 [Amylocystis lapponica]